MENKRSGRFVALPACRSNPQSRLHNSLLLLSSSLHLRLAIIPLFARVLLLLLLLLLLTHESQPGQPLNDLRPNNILSKTLFLQQSQRAQSRARVCQELRVLRRLPIGVEVGQVRGESLRVRVSRHVGGVVVVVVAGGGCRVVTGEGARDAQEVWVGDGQVGEIVGVCEGRDEFELEDEARVGERGRGLWLRLVGGERLLLLFHGVSEFDC